MNIKQAAEQSGVSSPNIRFYEKEGLMTPARNRGNAYRDYTCLLYTSPSPRDCS